MSPQVTWNFFLNWLQIGGSHHPRLGSIICYNGPQNSRKHFVYVYWFIIKDTNEQPVEEVHRSRSRKVPSTGASISMEFGGALPTLHMDTFTNLEALWTPLFGDFTVVPICKHNRLNHWSLVIELNLQPLSPPWRLEVRGGAESSNPKITRLVPLATSPHTETI